MTSNFARKLGTLVATALAGSAGANVVVNGGFELAINPTNGWTQTPTGQFSQAATLGTFTPHSGGFMASTHLGSNVAGTNTLTQTLTLNAGDVVDFGMFYQDSSTNALANLTVVLDGLTIYTNTVGATSTSSWQAVSVPSITISNNNPVLAISVFSKRSNAIWLLDDVSVNVVPAPATALLGLAAIGMAGRRRRR